MLKVVSILSWIIPLLPLTLTLHMILYQFVPKEGTALGWDLLGNEMSLFAVLHGKKSGLTA